MERIKHECGVAMIRLLKPLSYYKEKYGAYTWGLSKLYLLMEKQHNRGQEGAGIGVVKMKAQPGNEYVFRERAIGSGAIQEIFNTIFPKLRDADIESLSPREVEEEAPFLGEIYMGHLRYSTTGRSGLSYVHPFLRRNNWRSRNLLLCGNFNMTNVDEIFQASVSRGQHPRIYADTVILLEQMGYALDSENSRLYRELREKYEEPQLTAEIENRMQMNNVLESTVPMFDGGFVICGATGSGDMFAVRDRHGIRPAFYYADDEVVVVASERPVIRTVFNVEADVINELLPGQAIIVNKSGKMHINRIMEPGRNERCSFERVYFSRGSDSDIYLERKALGRNLVTAVDRAIDSDLQNTVFSFIPNTAEIAFCGLIEGFQSRLDKWKAAEILRLQESGTLTPETVSSVIDHHIRIEKAVIKDIKLRTFISEGASRDELAAHVYDITYGCIKPGEKIVVIDDSIVRGTTLRQSILSMLDRLNPGKIVIVSSSPQVRYPDYYGIDMSRMAEFIAFRAAVALLKESGRSDLLREVYDRCIKQRENPYEPLENHVKAIYAPFTDEEISRKIVELLTPADCRADVQIIYQTIEGLHEAIQGCPGDWYFSGNYPTPGGTRLVNQAYINYYEGNYSKR